MSQFFPSSTTPLLRSQAMEKDKNSSKLLDSISPMSILDALAESIIDLVRPAAIARLQAHNPSNQKLIVIQEAIENGFGSGSLSLHSGVNFCQITVILNPTLPECHPSHLPQLQRRCLHCGPVNIFMSPQSIELTRHESRKTPSSACTCSSLSWIRSLFDSDPNLLPWKRGSLDVLPIIVERLDFGIRGFERLFQLATEYKSDSKVPQILGAIHTLRQMIRVVSPGVEKSRGKGIDKRKCCSVESFASECSNIIPHKSMSSRHGCEKINTLCGNDIPSACCCSSSEWSMISKHATICNLQPHEKQIWMLLFIIEERLGFPNPDPSIPDGRDLTSSRTDRGPSP